ncbi:hypothetical protein H4R33_000605 [Dimargaris cristalligena]|nr:hypothetical protein H4R33_000605 [Dimargaris cristalligena]
MTLSNDMTNANFPVDGEGRTYHVGLKCGEVAHRVITVGDPERAGKFAKLLDQEDADLFAHLSHRGFYTITGTYKGVPVSIVAIGMGMSMMDFFVREVRAVVQGPMAMIRLGSCGSTSSAKVGDIIVPTEAIAVTRNFDFFTHAKGDSPYLVSEPVAADPKMTQLLTKELVQLFGDKKVSTGLNATCDSFYSSQGRFDQNFLDANQQVVDHLRQIYPQFASLEMETFMLYHLAATSLGPQAQQLAASLSSATNNDSQSDESPPAATPAPEVVALTANHDTSIRAAAAMMVFADRNRNQFIDKQLVNQLETSVGHAILETLIQTPLDV